MRIYIKISETETIDIDVEPSDSIENIKGKIQDKKGISPDSMDIYFNGKLLENSKTIGDYPIAANSTLSLINEPEEPEVPEKSPSTEITDSEYNLNYSELITEEETKIIYSSNILSTLLKTNKETLQNSIYSSSIITTELNFINEEEALTVLFGFSNYEFKSNEISFYIYFISVKNFLFSQKMIFHVLINNNSYLRLLQNYLVECNKVTNDNIKVKYLCKTEVTNSDIKRIICLKDFNFINQNNVKVIGITPIAQRYIDNLQNIEDKDLFDYNIYILNNAINNKYDNNLFNISGIISEKPNFGLINLILITNAKSENETTTEEEIDCNIVEIKDLNYTLNCSAKENINYDMQSSVSFIDNDNILLINFDNNTNSTLAIENRENFHGRYYRNNSGLSSTSLFLILFFSTLVPIILFILIFIIIRRKMKKRSFKIMDSISKEIIQVSV